MRFHQMLIEINHSDSKFKALSLNLVINRYLPVFHFYFLISHFSFYLIILFNKKSPKRLTAVWDVKNAVPPKFTEQALPHKSDKEDTPDSSSDAQEAENALPYPLTPTADSLKKAMTRIFSRHCRIYYIIFCPKFQGVLKIFLYLLESVKDLW